MTRGLYSRVAQRLTTSSALLLDSANFVRSWQVWHECDLWIGDSHALFLSGLTPRPYHSPRIAPSVPSRFVWHIGPRLMWSIARKGFPRGVRRTCGLAGLAVRTHGRRSLTLVFGEIDVRVHLGTRVGWRPFTSAFVLRGVELAERLRAQRLAVVSPVPPCDIGADNPNFPRVGSLAQRVDAHTRLSSAMRAWHGTTIGRVTVVVIDPACALAADDGSLHSDWTDDGCHTNPAGAALVQAVLERAVSNL